jgi:hypothetical protein
MEYLLQIYGDETIWARMPAEESDRIAGAYMAFTKALRDAGAYVDGNRLQSTSTATKVRVTPDGKTEVLDGPYADTKEQLGGYYVIEAPDLDAAIQWAARCPASSYGTVEVRPVFELSVPA